MRKSTPDLGMPDVTIQIESDGAYFCNHGGAGNELLGCLIARLTSEYGAVTITELE